jgi:hypothetical protein
MKTLNIDQTESTVLLAQYFKPPIDGSMLLEDDMAVLLNTVPDFIYKLIESSTALVTMIV